VIRAYEELKDGKEIADLWHKANMKQADPKPKAKDKTKAKSKDDSTSTAKRSRFSQPRTDTNFKQIVGVDEIPDLPDCPKKFTYGQPLLPDWCLQDVPSEMQWMHNWYIRACRLGLRTISAPYYSQVFGPAGPGITDVLFDFQDIHAMFCLKELDIEMVRLWCM
jgi:hypothetical protein